ncbi:hypothetical protein D3C72_2591450 [compost metagenome]
MVPDCDHVADQPCVRLWPVGSVNRSVHPARGAVPVLVMRTDAVKPELQLDVV